MTRVYRAADLDVSLARRRRVLVACVGNVLRRDDGFGIAVAQRLADALLPDVDVIETGIAGLRIVQELLEGYGAVIIVDTVDRGAAPGTLFVLEPTPPDPADAQFEAWQGELSNLHLMEPSRVLLLARAAGCLPDHVVLVGCQPERCDEFEEGLSQHVAAAVAGAARRVQELTEELLALLGK
jgi:hydrogenase maturation protease